MKTRRYLFLTLFLLGACASAQDSSPDSYLMGRKIGLPDKTHINHCHGYGCAVVTTVALTPKDIKQIQKVFQPRAKNAAQERKQVAKAIGLMERIVGARDGTGTDIRGTFVKTGNDQLDCVDESTNTTTYLKLFETMKLLRFHKVNGPTMRLPIINAGRWPHQTAVMTDIKTGIPWAVDSWFHDNGANADLIELKTWKSGWKPADIHEFL